MSKIINYKKKMLMVDGNYIKRSTNNGASWSIQATIQSSYGTPNDLTEGINDELLLHTSKYVLASKNGGASWSIRATL